MEKEIIPKKDNSSNAVALVQEFKVPAPKHRKKVLEEDDYEESIRKIIERDFYPDLTKLRAQSEYLEARSKNDVEKLRELHIKYGPKRVKQTPGGSSTNRSATDLYTTPSSFETPAETVKLNTPGPETTSHSDAKPPDTQTNVKPNTDVGLDKFLTSHTSEDNEAFVELMEEAEKKRREKQAWLYVKEGEQQDLQDKHLALPSMERQAAIEGNSTKLETWTYKPANAVMYNVEGAPFTAEEKITLAAKVRKINSTATRFNANPFKEPPKPQEPGLVTGVPGQVDFDGKEIGPVTPKVGGYNFVATPTPNPEAAGESPMMTWGEIEGTPFLLDASDQPMVQATPNLKFKLAEEPKRDRLGRELAEKVARKKRDKKAQAVERMRNRLNTPGTSRSDRLASLSPAARRLASSRGITIGTDKALRASYTPSPLTRPLTGGFSTPGHSSKTGSSGTPKIRTPRTQTKEAGSTPKIDVTDNLLNLPTKRKSKAADFF